MMPLALIGTLGFLALARHVPRRDPVVLPLVGLIYGGIIGAAFGALLFRFFRSIGQIDVVIGGGISGLSAASHLAQKGAK